MAEVRAASFRQDLVAGLHLAREADLAVAFVRKSGLDLPDVRAKLEAALSRGARIRLILDLATGNTDPAAVWDLVTLAEAHGKLQVRTLLADQGEPGALHAKFYLFRERGHGVLITGSANLTGPGLEENVEHGITVSGPTSDPLLSHARRFFDGLWESPRAVSVDRQAALLYEEFCGRRRSAEERGRRRSRAAWRRLADHLRNAPPPPFVWPSAEAAYLMGVITARGEFDDQARRVVIDLLFQPAAYKKGEIRVRNRAYPAVDRLPTIPLTIAIRAQAVLPSATVRRSGYRLAIDCPPRLYHQVREPFIPYSRSDEFRLPKRLSMADEEVVQEFVKGFAVASALLTDSTSLPGNRLTGLPGMMVVWLRPKKNNPVLFDQLYELIRRRLGMNVYRDARQDRDPHLKIRCEDFAQIGFGIDWWDDLVDEGVRYNQALFSAPSLPP